MDLLTILIAPLTISVRGVEVVRIRRNERSWDALVQQIIPGEVTQPRMVLDILGTVKSETIKRLALDETVNKVGCLDGPARWNVGTSDLHLPGQDMLADLASVSASVGPPAEHALVADDAHGEVVDGDAVRLAAHDFRCHVTWRARRIFLVLRIPHSGDTEISDLRYHLAKHKKFSEE